MCFTFAQFCGFSVLFRFLIKSTPHEFNTSNTKRRRPFFFRRFDFVICHRCRVRITNLAHKKKKKNIVSISTNICTIIVLSTKMYNKYADWFERMCVLYKNNESMRNILILYLFIIFTFTCLFVSNQKYFPDQKKKNEKKNWIIKISKSN